MVLQSAVELDSNEAPSTWEITKGFWKDYKKGFEMSDCS